MKNVKNTNDFFQSDLTWLDEPSLSSECKNAREKSLKKSKKQANKTIEIAGKIISLGYVYTPNMLEGRNKTSQKLRGVSKSASHCANISAAKKGIPNGRKGMPHSELHKQRIGDSNRGVSRKTSWLGRKHREDTKEKLRQVNLNRDPASYTYSDEKKVEISNKISAGKKGKKRSPEMMAKMAEQRAMNFQTPIGVFRDRSKAEKAYLELGHSKQDFKKLYIYQPDKFYFTNDPLTK